MTWLGGYYAFKDNDVSYCADIQNAGVKNACLDYFKKMAGGSKVHYEIPEYDEWSELWGVTEIEDAD